MGYGEGSTTSAGRSEGGRMFLRALRSAFPGRPFSQGEVWDCLRGSVLVARLGRRERRILEAVFTGDSGIQTRYFAVPPPELFEMGPEELNAAFEREAPALAVQALAPALADAGLAARDLDALLVCTCTGYLCPGVSGHVAERLGMRPDAALFDLVGLGCGAAIPTMQSAKGFLAMNPEAVVATVAVEVCSAAFDLAPETGVLVSACLFGDGASAAIWAAEPGGSRFAAWRAENFLQHHRPDQREEIRFVNREGKLRIQLARTVPAAAAEAVAKLYPKLPVRPCTVLVHPGGKDVIDAVQEVLPGFQLDETRAAMARCGNLSAPSVMVALEDHLRNPKNNDRDIWLCAFGTGFSAYACNLRKTPAGLRED